MDRFFLSPNEWEDGELTIRGEEAHHCLRVMRKSEGDELEIFDGAGRWARGKIISVEKESLQVVVETTGQSEPLTPAVCLALAIPKGKNMELIVQKSVELGVAIIQPLITEHTVVRLNQKESEKKREKWQRIALEACKQCGQNFLPTVEIPKDITSWVEGRSQGELELIASLADGAQGFREHLRNRDVYPKTVSVLVGPEGDFAGSETTHALEAGFQPVTLGEIVLRVETAALYAVGSIRYEFGR